MDGLCALFDVASSVGELLNRTEEKSQELESLATSAKSISQSVQMFAANLPSSERDEAFQSNAVFASLAEHLTTCRRVIENHRQRLDEQKPALENGQTPSRSWRQSGARTIREGLEALSGRLGALGTLASLPEDELETIRKAGQELHKLLPHVTLAVAVYQGRGQKRSADGQPIIREAELRSYSRSSEGHERILSLTATAEASLRDIPMVQLQLVSDHPAARREEPLPVLSVADLRPLSAASTSSLESAGSLVDGGSSSTRKMVFGRQELLPRLPKTITLPPAPGKTPQPVARFVSRDLFAIEVPILPPATPDDDTINMATLAFGESGTPLSGDDLGATLAFGGDSENYSQASARPPQPLAEVIGLSQGGLHVRLAGHTKWQWHKQNVKVPVRTGDRIAILLESPPNSTQSGARKDLEADEATCLMGVELLHPVLVA
mmetsp:Transcript_6779/g.15484  ORF Transcript_6779/g.15484 Transcript_6779/m.15484 type:complete len:437 (+) Transcript_6779:430-1740(+)|eukprot:CAMPEP_0206469546 /NCGR_PEP_ID=MMETSP0324_2-20121206/30349_1 /ASSEMBLY_ACC=CAM_ASM_000836 /TAXON_ID=2866 /ORGANISM="Crypthecodinium cohnii, Strain Seligo" /LENGTH=436 /DNA_ID=CAMNT_0053943335 /DNA_START=337 /DNA_END=1647 /DNA_ORIENTATION=-